MADETTTNEQTETTQSNERTFTQSELDRIVNSKLASFKSKTPAIAEQAVSKWREENGITDDLLEKLTKVEATVSEAKKLKTDYAKTETEYKKTQEKLNKVQSKLFDSITKATVADSTVKSNSSHIMWLLAKERLGVDEESYRVYVKDENGERDDKTKLDDLYKKILEDYPCLAPPSGLPGSGTNGGYLSRGNGTSTRNLKERVPGDELDFLKEKLKDSIF